MRRLSRLPLVGHGGLADSPLDDAGGIAAIWVVGVVGVTVMRTEYWNLGTGTVRAGATGHGESLTDVESYLLPLEQAQGRSLFSWGVAAGLRVSATSGGAGVTVGVGVALDGSGRLVVLAADGKAVVDPDVDPDEMVNVPTVTVPADGVVVATSAELAGERLLVASWREVESQGAVANAPVLLHAPWLRLLPAAGFQDVGAQVVLARVTVDGDGTVAALDAEGRRLVGTVAGRVALRVPRLEAGVVGDGVAGELGTRPDGGLELRLGGGAQARPVLTVEPASGNQVTMSLGADSVVARRADGSVALAVDVAAGSVTAHRPDGATTLTLDIPNGRLGLGTLSPLAKLHASDTGDFGSEDAAGILTSSNVPLLAQSDGAAVGALNADGRAAFVLSIDGNNHGNAERGVPTFYDCFDGAWRPSVSLKLGRVGIGTTDPTERLTVAGGGARVHGVAVGTGGNAVSYQWPYETVGVSEANYNLRLQSPNSIIFHTGGNPPQHRMELNASGGLSVRGDLAINDKHALRGNDAWLRLNQDGAFTSGVHTPGVLSSGSLNVGGVGGWANPGWGNLWISGELAVGGRHALRGNDTWLRLNQNGAFTSGVHTPGLLTSGSLNVGGLRGWANPGGGNMVVAGSLTVAASDPNPSGFASWSGGGIATWDLFAGGGVYVGADREHPAVQILADGRVLGRQKSFLIDHPLDPEHRSLVHACLEGPESAVFYRGRGRLVDECARVELPRYFEALTRDQGRTVMLTPIVADGARVAPLAASPVENGAFHVVAIDGGSRSGQEFYWEVKAVRADVDEVVAEPTKPD